MSEMKGIVLAGGSGTRLYPATLATNKQLLPVYDKPMIYFPFSALMLAGIRTILIISSPEYLDAYRRLFGDGGHLGLDISYAPQPRPEGLAQAYHIGAEFVGGAPSALVLGDNLFHGAGLSETLKNARSRAERGAATIFGYQVEHPSAYGVVDFGPDGRALTLEEKPAAPRSNWAVTGLYFYDGRAAGFARDLRPSARGELEITDLNRRYLEAGDLHVERLGRGYAWLDTGTHDSLLEAGEFVRTLQRRQGIQLACLEEIAWQQGFIDDDQLLAQAARLPGTAYGRYIRELIEPGRSFQ
jgi:glucose-1-phosphate thymidylyltransferase